MKARLLEKGLSAFLSAALVVGMVPLPALAQIDEDPNPAVDEVPDLSQPLLGVEADDTDEGDGGNTDPEQGGVDSNDPDLGEGEPATNNDPVEGGEGEPGDESGDDEVAIDLSVDGSASLVGDYYRLPDDNRPVFLLVDGKAEPKAEVHVTDVDGNDVTLVEGTDYSIVYERNDAVTTEEAFAQATIQGIAPYTGTIELGFEIVDALDLAHVAESGAFVVNGSSEYELDGASPCSVEADGMPNTPTVIFRYPDPEKVVPLEGRDFVVSYVDAEGEPVEELTDPGTYSIVLTASEEGILFGSAEIPFEITGAISMELADASPDYRDDYQVDYVEGEGGIQEKKLSFTGLLEDVSELVWSLRNNATPLVEGLDYVISSVQEAVDGSTTFTFSGKGRYEGDVHAHVYASGTPESIFSAAEPVRNHADGVSVFVDENGTLVKPALQLGTLTEGVDYVIDGYTDTDGEELTSAQPGETIYVRVVGQGAYDGLQRQISAEVVSEYNPISLDDAAVTMCIDGALTVPSADGAVTYLLEFETPSVSLAVSGSDLLLWDGEGFTVSTQRSSDEDLLEVTATADEGSRILSGTKTVVVTLVDSYDLVELSTQVGSDASPITLIDCDDTSDQFIPGSDEAVSLSYAGFSYVPLVSFPAFSVSPTVMTSLLDASGASVDAIDAAGSYTLVVTGTGDWTGSLELPLSVQDSTEGIDLSACNLSIGDVELVDGKAEPKVTLSIGGHEFVEGTDYDVKYGCNDGSTGRGWVKVFALPDSPLRGVRGANFTIASSENNANNISSGGYTLLLTTAKGSPTVIDRSHGVLRVYRPTKDALNPEVSVLDRNGKLLAEGSDYEVEFGDNSSEGLAYVKVTGTGAYEGTLSGNYYSLGLERVSIANAEVSIENQTYTGEELTPELTVTLAGEKLIEGDDYSVEYRDNTNAGTATAAVTGVGYYTGTVEQGFTISPKAVTVKALDATKTFGEEDPDLEAGVTGLVGEDALDYELTREEGDSVGTYAITPSGGELQGNYQVSYVSATLTIEAKDLATLTISELEEHVFDGEPQTPEPAVSDGDTTLALGEDYTLSYLKDGSSSDSCVNTGTYEVIAEGKGNYTGSLSTPFTIVAKSLDGATIEPIEKQILTSKAAKPKPVVKDGDNTLVLGQDYTLSYENNTTPGAIATVIVSGIGNYQGSISAEFEISDLTGKWMSSNGRWWYRWSDGSYPAGQMLEIDGKVYSFNTNGWMQTGWVKWDGSWYYFASSGAMVHGWQKSGSSWYYLDPTSGKMLNGWLEIGGKRYWLASSGVMATGWKQISGEWYYFASSGVMATGWKKDGSSWYYLDPKSGQMATGWHDIGGKRYLFANSGAMATGWKQISSKWYWFDSSGAMATGWKTIGSKRYWFNAVGVMATGGRVIDGKKYYFDDSGSMATGWRKVSGKWYWFDSSGVMATSRWVERYYYVGADGVMVADTIIDGYRILPNGRWDGKGKVA